MYHQEVNNKKKMKTSLLKLGKKINLKNILKKFIKRLSIFFVFVFEENKNKN